MVPKIALGSPLHSKERTSPLGGSALGPAGLCHRAVCLPACPQPRSMWTGLSLCLSEQPPQSRPAPTVPGRTPTATGPQLSGGVLAFNLTTPPPHAGTHRRNALATPLPEARKLQSPRSGQAGLGAMDWAPGSARSVRGAETGRGARLAWLSQVSLPSAPRGWDTASITGCASPTQPRMGKGQRDSESLENPEFVHG